MSCNARLFVVLALSSLLGGCYAPGTYGYGGYNSYNRSYSSTTPPQSSYGMAQRQRDYYQPTPIVAVPPANLPPVAPPVVTPPPVAEAAPAVPPAIIADAAADPAALPPLLLPVKLEWTSAKCPDVAVTFSGGAESTASKPTNTASFEEVRQYREGDYTETAECFCVKAGNLSEIKKPVADAIMEQTGRQFSAQLHMPVRHISFVSYSPVGGYSQLEASAEAPSDQKAVLRTYWRGQCSMRVAVVSSPANEMRAAEFLNSLHVLGAQTAKADDADAPPPAVPVEPITAADIAAASDTSQITKLSGGNATSGDLEQELRDKMAADPNRDVAAPVAVAADTVVPPSVPAALTSPAPVAVATAVSDQPALNPAARLRQLQELKKKGLISEGEYEGKRKIILNDL